MEQYLIFYCFFLYVHLIKKIWITPYKLVNSLFFLKCTEVSYLYCYSYLLCNKPPKLSGLKQHSFVLLMYLQFQQGLVETAHLCLTLVGATWLVLEGLQPGWLCTWLMMLAFGSSSHGPF